MICWMAGRSDGDNYGELWSTFSQGEGCFRTDADKRIDQDTLISEQLSLWDQRVPCSPGNLLVLPIDDTILYVEPVFPGRTKRTS